MRKALSISLVLTLVLAGAALAKPVDGTNSFDKFQYLDVSGQGTDLKSVSNLGVFGAAQQGTVYFGGTTWNGSNNRWEALPDSVWTFDTGVGSNFDFSNPDVNPFKSTTLHAMMEGWIGIDNSFGGINPYFRRLSDSDAGWDIGGGGVACVGGGAGLEGNWSWWAGAMKLEAEGTACFADGQGYGNSWVITVEKSYAYNGSGTATLSYTYVNDTEPDWDYSFVYVDTSGIGDDVEVASYTGVLGGSANINLTAGIDLPSAAGTIKVKFQFVADGAYSDEDGLYTTTCGAFAFDNVTFLGDNDTFEADAEGWDQSDPTEGDGGEWSNLVHLNDLPPPLTPCECNLDDTVLVFEDLTIGGHNLYSDNIAASPWIDLAAEGLVGAPGKFINVQGYFELPLLNYIFVQFNVQWYPQVCAANGSLITSPFTSNGFVYYFGGVPTCSARGGVGTRIGGFAIDPAAEQMRIAIGVLSYCRFFGNCTGVSNSTPWFDYVRLGVYGDPDAPFLSNSSIDTPYDSFPQDGTLRITSPGRVDCNNVKGEASPEAFSALGDTLIVDGGSGGAGVYVQFAIDPGPGTAADPNYAAWLGSHTMENLWLGLQWYSARMDTAEQGGSKGNAPTFMTTYHESDANFTGTDTDRSGDPDPNGQQRLANDIFPDDLFTAGTRINMFFKAQYDGSNPNQPFTGAWFTLPDTAGGNYFEMEVLPSSMAADSTWNCLLYVDHYNRGAQFPIETGLASIIAGTSANFEGTPWDRFDVNAESSQQGSFGRPLSTQYNCTVIQGFAYKAIIWSSGNLNAFNLVEEDANVLIPWLTLVDPALGFNNLYVSGDGIATSMTLEAASEPSALQLLEQYMGASYTCGTVRDPSCPGSPALQDTNACINVDPVGGPFTGNDGPNTVYLEGNGCPQLRSFDLLGTAGGAVGAPAGNESYDSVVKGLLNYTSIANSASGGPDYKTVIDGASVHYRRDDTCTDIQSKVTDRLDRVLDWFGYGTSQVDCSDPTAGLGIGDDFVRESGFKTTLANFAPNPLVGAAEGRIQFTMAKEGKAAVDIFDVNGRLVNTVFDGIALEGVNEAFWNGTGTDGRPVASGVYFYRLRAEGKEFAKKLVVVRNGN